MRYDATRSTLSLQHERRFSLAAANGQALKGYLQDTGRGPVGVFVHGFRSTCAGDKSLALAHSAALHGRSWLRFDLRGHGGSGGDFRDFRVSAALEDVLAVLDWCPPRPVVIIGSSLGGWLAVLAAEIRPERIAQLVLIAPAFNFLDEGFAALFSGRMGTWRARGEMTFDDPFAGGQFTMAYAVLADARRFDVLDRDLSLRCPVDIYHGEQDQVVSIGLSRRFAERVDAPGVVLHAMPGGDHRLIHAVPLILASLAQTWETYAGE